MIMGSMKQSKSNRVPKVALAAVSSYQERTRAAPQSHGLGNMRLQTVKPWLEANIIYIDKHLATRLPCDPPFKHAIDAIRIFLTTLTDADQIHDVVTHHFAKESYDKVFISIEVVWAVNSQTALFAKTMAHAVLAHAGCTRR